MKRREAIGLLGALSTGTFRAATHGTLFPGIEPQEEGPPALAPGTPTSPERVELIERFKTRADGVERQFEARTFASDWTMPYRLFRPSAAGRLPLVMYLHGSGGLGDDNEKQMGFGNIFGTRLWALPETQQRFPCYVVVPQTDRGWIRYAPAEAADSVARAIPGLGDGARVALEMVDALCREFPIDQGRLYVTGQSLGGGGVWHMLAHRPRFFAAAAPCCGSRTLDDPAASGGTPLWNFHGDADTTVPPAVSRDRIAALRTAGQHPFATEYAGVGHNVWEWAYTEPALAAWVFGQRRAG